MVSNAQTTSLRFQSTWPAKDIFHEYAQDFAKKVNDMAGARLKIEVLPAGAVVPAFQLLEAVSKGTLDGGHGVIAYHYGKNSALALWGSGPAFGMDPNMVLAWHNYGGGKALVEEIYKSLNMDVVTYLYGPMPTQPLGWFKKPVAKAADMKGLKFRTVGLAVDVFTDMGVAVKPLPGGEIVPALDRGLIDAAEFNNASSDRVLGFADVAKNCMLQSFHWPRRHRAKPPSSRLSSTDISPNSSRFSGTSATPRRTMASTVGRAMVSPPSVKPPCEGNRPMMAFSSVVLPAPLGPMTVTISPSPTCSSIPWMACTGP